MQRTILAAAVLFSAVMSAQANAAATLPVSDIHSRASPQHHSRKAAPRSDSGVVTYNRDAKDPNIGWHWEDGMRTCHQDCDNPEIPGSGYTCRNVQFLGMAMRECDSSN